ncbi:putative metal ion binding protein [Trypoxylus dichotomus]
MTERGERLIKQRNKNKQKLRYRRKTVPNTKIKQKTYFKKNSLINEQSDWNGAMFPFKGTDDIYKTNKMLDAVTFEDTEWEQEGNMKPKININNALGALISAYSIPSDDSDCEKSVLMESKTETVLQNPMYEKHISDNESPLQEPVSRLPFSNTEENKSSYNQMLPLEEKSLEDNKKQKRHRFVYSNRLCNLELCSKLIRPELGSRGNGILIDEESDCRALNALL